MWASSNDYIEFKERRKGFQYILCQQKLKFSLDILAQYEWIYAGNTLNHSVD